MYLHAKPGLIAEDGTITAEATRDSLLHALTAFRQHIAAAQVVAWSGLEEHRYSGWH
jgi:hypothetical protein